MKVMTLVGTRPEIIKLSCVIPELDRAAKHVLVHTGQNYDYELNQIFFDGLGLRKPDHFFDAAGASAAQTIANVIAKSDEVMRAEKPDAFLLLGDTNSCLAVIAAKRLKIPIFHMEAGNRCFDERVPDPVLLGRSHAGTEVAEIIEVRTRDNDREVALLCYSRKDVV